MLCLTRACVPNAVISLETRFVDVAALLRHGKVVARHGEHVFGDHNFLLSLPRVLPRISQHFNIAETNTDTYKNTLPQSPSALLSASSRCASAKSFF